MSTRIKYCTKNKVSLTEWSWFPPVLPWFTEKEYVCLFFQSKLESIYTIKKWSSDNLVITFSNLQSLNDTRTICITLKNSTGDRGQLDMLWASTWSQMADCGHQLRSWLAKLTGGMSRFQSSSFLGGMTHSGQWSVHHLPLSSKGNRVENNMYTNVTHLIPGVKVNLAFPLQG